jgi:sulfide dehydrogenase [flavocytochrome c] flavoprotein subunit
VHLTRRQLIRAAGAAALAAPTLWTPRLAAAPQPRVVIVGGGIGGATAAKYLRLADPGVHITLVEQQPEYVTCPRSNDVIVGLHTLDEITFGYGYLEDRYGVDVVIDRVTGLDPERRLVDTAGGTRLPYDRLLVSPGVDFRWDAIDGYTPEVAAERLPHAWKAGPQTLLLKRQLEAMPAGGVVVIAPPPNPFRCPPGPYERASMVVEWCRRHKPRAKVLILDAKDRFTKQAAFKQGWERLYGYGTPASPLEWVSKSDGGRVIAVDPGAMTAETDWETVKADVINIIPRQTAGALAFAMGLADDSGWCPVDPVTFESTRVPHVHVVGDAAVAGAMPKSGFAANTQAKVAARAMSDLLRGREPGVPSFANTCFSLVGERYGVSVAGVYRVADGTIVGVPASGGTSPLDAGPAQPVLEAVYQRNWHRTFVQDVFS